MKKKKETKYLKREKIKKNVVSSHSSFLVVDVQMFFE